MIRFDIDSNKGQGTAKQRQMLYNVVLAMNPALVLEIGTWKGYGSTYTILEALEKLDDGGKLITYEIDQANYKEALGLYCGELKHLSPRLEIVNGNALDDMADLKGIDMAWLDGSDDPDETLQQVKILEKSMVAPRIIGCHDWNLAKMSLAKPYLLSIANTICTDNESVGIWFGRLK